MASLARVKGIKGCSASAAATCPGGQNLEDNLKNLGAKVQGIAPVHGFQGEPDVSPRFTAFHEGFECIGKRTSRANQQPWSKRIHTTNTWFIMFILPNYQRHPKPRFTAQKSDRTWTMCWLVIQSHVSPTNGDASPKKPCRSNACSDDMIPKVTRSIFCKLKGK